MTVTIKPWQLALGAFSAGAVMMAFLWLLLGPSSTGTHQGATSNPTLQAPAEAPQVAIPMQAPAASPASPVIPAANVAPVESAPPDRTQCADVRGTPYRSDTEREWFLANCIARSPGVESLGVTGTTCDLGLKFDSPVVTRRSLPPDAVLLKRSTVTSGARTEPLTTWVDPKIGQVWVETGFGPGCYYSTLLDTHTIYARCNDLTVEADILPRPKLVCDDKDGLAYWVRYGANFLFDFNPNGGRLVNDIPRDFCLWFDCIANFANGRGYIVRCPDGTYSKSGGIPGSCNLHGGSEGLTVGQPLYRH